MVENESFSAFERAFNRKNCLTMLDLYSNVLNDATASSDTAIHDSETPKQQVENHKARHDAFGKTKESISHRPDPLK